MQRRPRSSAVAQRGFTLIEVAIASSLVVGLSTGFMMTLRYGQMIDQGKAAGQQLARISEGATLYMKRYGAKLSSLSTDCVKLNMTWGPSQGSAGAGASTTPECSIKLDEVTVRNGYQPTVPELVRLGVTSAGDALLLPFTPGIVTDLSAQDVALPRIAISIRRVQRQVSEDSGAATPVAGTSGVTSGQTWSRPAGTASVDLSTDVVFDVPPTLYGVSCHDGGIRPSDSGRYVPGVFVWAKPENLRQNRSALRRTAAFPGNSSVINDGDLHQENIRNGYSEVFRNGYEYCLAIQQRYGEGIFDTATSPSPEEGNGSAPDSAKRVWALEATVFNSQPYYYGVSSLPMGAAAQLGAALESVGYSGRLSGAQESPAASRMLRGMRGQQLSDNPLQSPDGSMGVPGVLAAVSYVTDTEATGSTGTGSTGSGWDTQAGLIQGQQLAGHTAVFGVGETVPAKGQNAAVAIKGGLLMGASSTLMADQVDAAGIRAENLAAADTASTQFLDATGQGLALGANLYGASKPFTVYLSDDASIRLPRAMPNDVCSGFADIAMSRALMITEVKTGSRSLNRFDLRCTPMIADTPDDPATIHSRWRSEEYNALKAKYGNAAYTWTWFDTPQDIYRYRQKTTPATTFEGLLDLMMVYARYKEFSLIRKELVNFSNQQVVNGVSPWEYFWYYFYDQITIAERTVNFDNYYSPEERERARQRLELLRTVEKHLGPRGD